MSKLSLTFPKTPLYLFLFFLISIPLKVISQNVTTERAILLNIKQQLGNPSSIQDWNSSSSPCDWPEIRCINNSVTEILLSNKNIYQEIPSTMCDLKNLTKLDLSWNYIPGEFPKVLYNCLKLQYLDLSQNYFVGPVPDDIDQISTLQHLDLTANNFSGNIPSSIGRLPDLRLLSLVQNQFNGTFPKEIGNLVNLEYLGMAYNGFVPMAIPEEFGQLKELTYLWIKKANLIGNIPDSFSNLSNLVHLDLSVNNLEGPILDNLLLFQNMTDLYLFQNKLSGEIPKTIQALNLVNIDFSMNNLTGSIPEDFGKLQNLKQLILYSNQLSGVVPPSIGLIPNLTIFRVFMNTLNGSLPPEIGLNSKLEAFEVSDNQFSGQLPENLCAGGVLQGVIAFSNNLSGQVPKSLGNCRTLRTVQLYNNNFSGELPSGLWTTFNLSSLLLSDNSFSGEVPGKLAWNLSRLEISNNRFSGQIPVQIDTWASMIVFEASNNLFSGKIPMEVTALSSLATLLLDGNQLSGELPSEILSWNSLTTLNLSRNELSGQIPAAFGSLPDLLELDLSENQFSGEIPPEIGSLRLTSLNLSSNKLSGQIPDAFDNLAYEDSFLNNSNLCANKPVIDLPNCYNTLHNSKNLSSKLLATIFALAATVFLVTILCTFFLVRDYRRKQHDSDLATWKLTSFHILDFNESHILSSLTESNLIGSGGSGKVYRITINSMGDLVAVKRIWNNRKLDYKLEKEFIAEVEILGTIRHNSIVKLLCCISSEDSKLLVYEYMENQSLDGWLHGRKRRSTSGSSSVHHFTLDWPTRLQIAIGAAQGLCYMHHDCSPQILHRDVKSSNILLDSEFKAKIADFGLAKILAKDGEPHTMSGVAGSFGYIAPEYAYTTKVNEKIDIYSFGVVLLELVTGREANSGDEHTNLAEWAWRHYGEEKPINDALDPEIKEPCYLEEMTTVFKLGLICTSTLPSSRPSMKEVLHILGRCVPPERYEGKTIGSEFDVAPLLGTASYLSGYKR